MKNMKKTLTFVAAGMIAVFTATSAFATDVIKLNIDGNIVGGPVTPVSQKGRTLVPLRVIFEALDAEVTWDNATKTVTGSQGDKEIVLKMNDTTAKVDGKNVTLDVPGQIIQGSVYVPVRFIAESLGAGVEWNAEQNTVFVKSDEKSAETPKEEAEVEEEQKPAETVKEEVKDEPKVDVKALRENETREWNGTKSKLIFNKDQISQDAIFNNKNGLVRFSISDDDIKNIVAKEKNKSVNELKVLDLTKEGNGRKYSTLFKDNINVRALEITQEELLSYDLVIFKNAYLKNIQYVRVDSGIRLTADYIMTMGFAGSVSANEYMIQMFRPMNYIDRNGNWDMYVILDTLKEGNIGNYTTMDELYVAKWYKVFLSEGTGTKDFGFAMPVIAEVFDKNDVWGLIVDKKQVQSAIPEK